LIAAAINCNQLQHRGIKQLQRHEHIPGQSCAA